MNKVFSTNIKGIRFVSKLNKWRLPSVALNQLFENLAPYVNIYMSAEIINELAGGRDVSRLVRLVVITVAADLLIAVVKGFMSKFEDHQQQVFENAENRLFLDYGFKMDYAHLENPDIQRRRAKIDESMAINYFGIQNMFLSFRGIVDNIIKFILSVGFMSGLVLSVMKNPREVSGILIFPVALVLFIAVSVILTVRIGKKSGEAYNELSNTMLGITRVSRGFPSGYKLGKDMRIYDMHNIRAKIAVKNRQAHAAATRKLMLGNAKRGIPVEFLSKCLDFTVYAFVCVNAVNGVLDIGGVVKYVGFITKLVSSVKGLLGSRSMLETNLPFLEHYLAFWEIENTMYHGTIPVEKRRDNEYEIEFRNVSFKYPGSDAYALKDLSMKLNIGQRLAVVGMNGSGKTTMIKLLCRLYDPTEGSITLNGIDIRKYDYEEYQNIFSVVFQDFKLFSFTLGQNVAAAVDYNREAAAERLTMAGFGGRLERMPKGLETMLYKDFDEDGVEVSGGEAQKIALARALYKDAPFIVLDEPTAALDPVAEYEIYSKFNEIVGGKTAVYISHRLSSCRFCDDIAVFHQGRLIQRGNHDKLISDEAGKYHELWYAQAKYYNEQTAV